ncbi:MAG: LytTR family DNA-binding domain-containing protein [Eubacteriales bacterium]|nr:LytTR family DNA-binding domain-containing protein [Eubacteriales bacterium]
MKIRIEPLPAGKESEIILYCHDQDSEALRLLDFLNSTRRKLIGHRDNELVMIDPESIYYCESVDDHVYIYLNDQVIESRNKLYEIEREVLESPLFRASRSLIVNSAMIVSVRPLFDGRLEAHLKNRERVIISRNYVPDLKRKLGI